MDGHIYLFGGYGEGGYADSVYRYDVQVDEWELVGAMAEPRGFLAATTLNDEIYVVGGFDGTKEFRSCARYDPASSTWTPCAPMTLRRGGLVVVAVREHLYALGGGMQGYLAFNERYDYRADAWTRIETPVTEEWQSLGAAFVWPYVYAIGGRKEVNLSVNEAYRAFYQIVVP
jgi:N-acetylneuraminic acid mutarotase